MPTSIDDLGMDLLQNILARLPSVDLTSANCVSGSWKHVCGFVLCRRPKLSSVCSFSSSLQVAVEDVVNKVLLEPIRPYFAIASVFRFDLEEAHQLINAKLGSKFPVITNRPPRSNTRRDETSREFKETLCTWKDGSIKEEFDPSSVWETAKGGIMLTIGFVPGLKLQPISLLKQNLTSQDSRTLMTDKFITDIREFSTSISGCEPPSAIIIFSEPQVGIDVVMKKLDFTMSSETVIVGYECEFKHTNGSSRNINVVDEHASAAIALVFVMDTNNPRARTGKTEFRVVLSSGLIPAGSVYAASIKQRYGADRTALIASREGCENLDGGTLVNQAFPELVELCELCETGEVIYIGVTKRRKCSFGWMTSLSFHEISMFNREYIVVIDADMGIESGDTFRLFYPDPTIAANVSNDLRYFKQRNITHSDKWELFGGLIFTSFGRSGSFVDQPNFDSSMFFDNFPGVTLGRTFYGRVFGRGKLTSYAKESQEHKSVCCMHEYCAAYIIMSYTYTS